MDPTNALSQNSNDVVFEVSHLFKSYGGSGKPKTDVLRGLSLKLFRGQSCALMGPSGSGKSTFLYCLGLLESWDSGRILCGGKDLSRLSIDEKAQFRLQNIGFVFQFHHLIYELSVWENILLPAQIKGEVGEPVIVWAKELLQRVGLTDQKDKFPSQLSGGEQQRVAVARAMVNKPQFLFTDEATGNLDSKRADSVLDLILQMCLDTRTTVLSVTHDEKLASRYARKLRMEDGIIIDE
jgi:ABC-type lipoprotein export system ATPase subunit